MPIDPVVPEPLGDGMIRQSILDRANMETGSQRVAEAREIAYYFLPTQAGRDAADALLQAGMLAVLEELVTRVNNQAERTMLSTGVLEGAHKMALDAEVPDLCTRIKAGNFP